MSTFLKAEWRKLAMANYAIDPEILRPYVPNHTELDLWNGRCYVSLVGFLFTNTRIKGVKVPYHIHFEEVNLRFYVRYNDNGEWKRGVVFIKEIVQRPALTLVANTVYGEPYETLPMAYSWTESEEALIVDYRWKKNGSWNNFEVVVDPKAVDMLDNSEEEFITEHFWGYTKRRNGYTSEYEVQHPRWQIYPLRSYAINVDYAQTYGEAFGFLDAMEPVSVFLAEGSEIKVKKGKRID
jgi:uncharacterized protein YqjF (DUF2071 family)